MIVKFVVEGRPKTKGDLLPCRKGDKVWCRWPDGVKAWERVLREAARKEMEASGFPLINARCVVHHRFYIKPTKTGRLRGDIDKLERMVLDALTGVVYEDDELVVASVSMKCDVEENGVERTEVSVSIAT